MKYLILLLLLMGCGSGEGVKYFNKWDCVSVDTEAVNRVSAFHGCEKRFIIVDYDINKDRYTMIAPCDNGYMHMVTKVNPSSLRSCE